MADEIFAPPPGINHYPSSWPIWCDAIRAGHSPASAGLACLNTEVNRFAARYRLASAFKGVKLDDYGVATADAYSAVFKLLLSYAAFEAFCRADGAVKGDVAAKLSAHLSQDVIAATRALDRGNTFYNAILPSLQGEVKTKILAYLGGQDVGFTQLCAAVRHHFAHGELTPHIRGTKPSVTRSISLLLANELLHCMNAEFTARAGKFGIAGA